MVQYAQATPLPVEDNRQIIMREAQIPIRLLHKFDGFSFGSHWRY